MSVSYDDPDYFHQFKHSAFTFIYSNKNHFRNDKLNRFLFKFWNFIFLNLFIKFIIEIIFIQFFFCIEARLVRVNQLINRKKHCYFRFRLLSELSQMTN